MKSIIAFLFVFVFALLTSAQTIQFISTNSGSPLPQVFVYDLNGRTLAESNIEGKISTEKLKPFQEKYDLFYENAKIGELGLQDLNKEVIKLNDRTKTLEPLTISNNTKAKFVHVKGYFTANALVDGYTNAYADGIATHVFDNKTKKYLYTVVEQYRVFRRSEINQESRSMAEVDYSAFLQVLVPKILEDMEEVKTKRNKQYTYREVSTTNKDVVELRATKFDDKVKKLFGIWLTKVRGDYMLAFDKGSKKDIRDFRDARLLISAKIKHRSEGEYHDLLSYRNFYPADLVFSDQAIKNKVKLKKDNSFYTEQYWEKDGFPQMKEVLNNFREGKFREMKNSAN